MTRPLLVRGILVVLVALALAQPGRADSGDAWRKQKIKELESQIKAIQARIKANEKQREEGGKRYQQAEAEAAKARTYEQSILAVARDAAGEVKAARDAQPDAPPTDPQLSALQQRQAEAQAAYDAAIEPVMAQLNDNSDYRRAVVALESARRWRDEQRELEQTPDGAGQTPLARASAEVLEAERRVSEIERAALEASEPARAARAALDEASEAVAAYRREQAQANASGANISQEQIARQDLGEAQQALREATRARMAADAEVRRIQAIGRNLEDQLAADRSLLSALQRELDDLKKTKKK